MVNNQNNISQSLRNYLFNAFKPFKIASHWYCGSNDTTAGKDARVICSLSTLLMVASGILLYEHHVFKDDVGNNNSPLAIGFAITFSFGLPGYIITPIVGHKCCGTFDTNYHTIITDIEQPIQHELNNNNQLHSYKETAV
ncbi:MAG: hypothetical protein sL5_08030 [Candidatus Mesenet longicola]|uniref:Uncharacterized protein n=1 Tax=Candidatus Mesenet longicola TaxID=1892558 RepID=A0A8J3MPD6_9RICK|nr:MAG: hypothetical protein sGL2_08420 [Candidatus Mesenet longicola]GHM59810.1 MAG: hypothetical protein sL5_08030 [Candidatus Mesenet longicola]